MIVSYDMSPPLNSTWVFYNGVKVKIKAVNYLEVAYVYINPEELGPIFTMSLDKWNWYILSNTLTKYMSIEEELEKL